MHYYAEIDHIYLLLWYPYSLNIFELKPIRFLLISDIGQVFDQHHNVQLETLNIIFHLFRIFNWKNFDCYVLIVNCMERTLMNDLLIFFWSISKLSYYIIDEILNNNSTSKACRKLVFSKSLVWIYLDSKLDQ